MVVSYNPGYRRGLEGAEAVDAAALRGVGIRLPAGRGGGRDRAAPSPAWPRAWRAALVGYAAKVRRLEELALAETVSTRLLVTAGQLIAGGLAPRAACQVAIVQPLTDDPTAARTLQDLADLTF